MKSQFRALTRRSWRCLLAIVEQLNIYTNAPGDPTEREVIERENARVLDHMEGSADMMPSTVDVPQDAATRAADDDFAVDNYEQQLIHGQTVRFRPGPIAGDPAIIGEQIRKELAERAEASE